MKRSEQMIRHGVAAIMAFALMLMPAAGMSFGFEGEAPGQTFWQSTSTDINYIADNGQIVVGTDGTISSGTTGNVTSGPLSTVELPVGEYPEAYGFQTDVDIAMNSVFPNELGPTSQNQNYYTPVFTPTVDSGALPTGYAYLAAAYTPAATIGGVTFVSTGYAPMSPYSVTGVYGKGATPFVATATDPIPTITKGGAIGRLTISSIGVNEYVYEGASESNMNKGLAHFDCTPGYLGNIAVAGHNRGKHAAFAKLKDLNLGDTVTYTSAYGTATYQVSNITTCATDDVSGLTQDGLNKITMYSCVADQPDIKLVVTATMIGENR